MEFKYQKNQDDQNNDKLKELRGIQDSLGSKFSLLNHEQVKLYYQKQALIKLNELFVQLYQKNSQNPYLDFIYKFLDENNTIFNFKKDCLLSLLSTVDFITSLNNIDVSNISDSSINQKIQEQFYKSKKRPKEIIVKKDKIRNIYDEFEKNNIMESEGSFVHEYSIHYEKFIYLNQLYMLILLKEIINFYHKRLLKEQKSKIPLIPMINLDELTIITRKDIHKDYQENYLLPLMQAEKDLCLKFNRKYKTY
jgi:hypothetical protein